MKKLIYSCFIFVICAFHLTAQTTIQETKLNSINGVLSLNNEPYSGHVISVRFSEEIKSSYNVIQGYIEGTVEEYFATPFYTASKYKDTSKINYWNLENKSQKNELLKIDSDSIKIAQELADFISYKIGGQKKLGKLSIKNSEGNLKEKDKVLYDQYLQFEKNRSILSKQKKQLLNYNIALQIQLEKELNKPLYSPVIQSKYNMLKSVKSGFYKQYSEKGLILTDGQYASGKQDGLWTYNYPNGNNKAQGNFKDGAGSDISDVGIPRNGREGKWTIQYENGKVMQEGNYLKGKRIGIMKAYYENGIMKEEESFLDDKLNGLRKVYFENGNKRLEDNYKNEKLNGKYLEYAENGNLVIETNYQDDDVNGLYKEYYSNGNVKQESNYLIGVQNGKFKKFYENGKLEAEGFTKQGKIEGLFKQYFDNGNLKAEMNFIKGNAHGLFKSYFESGKINVDGNVDSTSLYEGNLYGQQIEYNEDGTIKYKFFVNKDGTIIDNTPKSVSALSPVECKKSYKCKCCKAIINGIYDGVNDEGKEADESTIDFFFKSYCDPRVMNSFAALDGITSPYIRIRNMYPYCTRKCANLCY